MEIPAKDLPEVAVEGQGLWGHAGVDPALEDVYLFGAPGPVTRHRPTAKAFNDGRCVGLNVGEGPKVERPRHRLTVVLPEQRFDVALEHDRLACAW